MRIVFDRNNVSVLATLVVLTLLLNRMIVLDWDYQSRMLSRLEPAKNITATKNTTTNNNGGGNDDSPAFQWEFLDLQQEINCGSDKCLFRSSTRTTNDTSSSTNHSETTNACGGGGGHLQELLVRDAAAPYQTGYLVGKDSKYDESILDGWKISQYLVQRFGIKHFFLEPPIRVSLDKSRFETLFFPRENRNYYYGATTATIDPNVTHEKQRAFLEKLAGMDDDTMTTTVQKIRIAPKTSRELRRSYTKEKIELYLDELLDGFGAERGILPVTDNSINNNSSSSNNNNNNHTRHRVLVNAENCGFFRRLSQEIANTIDLLHCEPLMALDFQFILDTSGNLYHLDFDRVITNQGGLRKYNQTKFDAKVRARLEDSMDLLGVVQRWIRTKQDEIRSSTTTVAAPATAAHAATSTTGFPSETSPLSGTIVQQTCKGQDWEAEETAILASKNLPCRATERIAMARHTTTSTMMNQTTTTTVRNNDKRTKDRVQLRHPLLIALLRRVIQAGFYDDDEKATTSWDCNAYGDRVLS